MSDENKPDGVSVVILQPSSEKADVMKAFLDALPQDETIVNHIASQCELFSQMHEKEAHDGAQCMDERINLIAFLCHRIGVRFQNVLQLVERIENYELYHEQHEHKTT